MLQHNIEAIHRLTIIEGLPVIIFSRDELSEETMLPSGSFELFWYTFNDKDQKFYGSMEVIPNLENIEENVELLAKQAAQTITELKK